MAKQKADKDKFGYEMSEIFDCFFVSVKIDKFEFCIGWQCARGGQVILRATIFIERK